MKYTPVVIFCFILSSIYCSANEYTYTYTPGCSKAYQQYMSLQLAEGTATIMQEIRQNPYNLLPTYLADNEDCLLLLFNGDKNDYEQRKGHMDARLDLLGRGDENSPWYRFCRAGIYMHWAFIGIRFGDNLKAATYFRRSFLLLKENRKLFPAFEYNDVLWGLEVTAVGAIPDSYKWIAAAFGLKGDVKKGIGLITGFLNKHTIQDPLYNEAQFYYAYLGFYVGSQQELVWKMLSGSQFHAANNLLNLFLKTNIALNYRKADAAIQALQQAQSCSHYNDFPAMDFEMASALYLKLDGNCISYYKKFLSRYKGGMFVKESWQRIGLTYYLQGNMPMAMAALEKVKQQGTTHTDADKQAMRFAKENKWPDKVLLQARLLIDGGYYQQALDKIGSIKSPESLPIGDKLEYYFRLGRAEDELGNTAKAIACYEKTINMGKERPEHFAARAALQMGFIYEKQNNVKRAIAMYQECLDMPEHDFQNSIDQQAKAGINRLNSR